MHGTPSKHRTIHSPYTNTKSTMNFKECDDHLGAIQNSLQSIYDKISALNISDEALDLFDKLKLIISDNLNILNDLRTQSQAMIEDKIQCECDQDMMKLQLQTVEEQLKLHVKHSGTDQEMLLKMMAEIESLKEEKYDLSTRLQKELENNQRRFQLLHDQQSNGNDDLSKEDKESFIATIERYHCKLLALESVIEGLRRKGIQIPEFPIIARTERQIGVNKVVKKIIYKGTDDQKQQQKIEEFVKEIKYLHRVNDESQEKFMDVQDMMEQIKKHLCAKEEENDALIEDKMKLKQQIEEEKALRSDIGRTKVLKLVMLATLIVGMLYGKKLPLIEKVYL